MTYQLDTLDGSSASLGNGTRHAAKGEIGEETEGGALRHGEWLVYKPKRLGSGGWGGKLTKPKRVCDSY